MAPNASQPTQAEALYSGRSDMEATVKALIPVVAGVSLLGAANAIAVPGVWVFETVVQGPIYFDHVGYLTYSVSIPFSVRGFNPAWAVPGGILNFVFLDPRVHYSLDALFTNPSDEPRQAVGEVQVDGTDGWQLLHREVILFTGEDLAPDESLTAHFEDTVGVASIPPPPIPDPSDFITPGWVDGTLTLDLLSTEERGTLTEIVDPLVDSATIRVAYIVSDFEPIPEPTTGLLLLGGGLAYLLRRRRNCL